MGDVLGLPECRPYRGLRKGEIRTQITDAASSARMTYLIGKNIFYEGGHDEYQHDNADDANNA